MRRFVQKVRSVLIFCEPEVGNKYKKLIINIIAIRHNTKPRMTAFNPSNKKFNKKTSTKSKTNNK